MPPPSIVLIRHGDTEWSTSGRHSGHTDIPLTAGGEVEAATLPVRLRPWRFRRVLCSPLQRARRTCAIAGLDARAEYRDDLMEWDYGELDGQTLSEWDTSHPGWDIWRDGCPGGESIEDVGVRADRVIDDIDGHRCDTAIFAHGHVLRAVAARWLGLHPAAARNLEFGTTALGVLTWNRSDRVLECWNLGPDVVIARPPAGSGAGGAQAAG